MKKRNLKVGVILGMIMCLSLSMCACGEKVNKQTAPKAETKKEVSEDNVEQKTETLSDYLSNKKNKAILKSLNNYNLLLNINFNISLFKLFI